MARRKPRTPESDSRPAPRPHGAALGPGPWKIGDPRSSRIDRSEEIAPSRPRRSVLAAGRAKRSLMPLAAERGLLLRSDLLSGTDVGGRSSIMLPIAASFAEYHRRPRSPCPRARSRRPGTAASCLTRVWRRRRGFFGRLRSEARRRSAIRPRRRRRRRWGTGSRRSSGERRPGTAPGFRPRRRRSERSTGRCECESGVP
jgi:hypothetical protein